MKIIQFDLPIGGVKVRNIEELRKYFSTEIIGHYRSNRLSKWLQSRNLISELKLLEGIDDQDDMQLLKRLCEIFSLSSDDESLRSMVKTPLLSESKGIREEEYCTNETGSERGPKSQGKPCISDDDINQLLIDNNQSKLSLIAKTYCMDYSTQDRLYHCSVELIKTSLADNPFLSHELQMRLLSTGTVEIRHAIACNSNISSGAQMYLIDLCLDKHELDIIAMLARNPALEMPAQEMISVSPSQYIRSELARNPSLTDELQEKLTKDHASEVRSSLAENKNLKSRYMSMLANDSFAVVKISLARHPFLQGELQAILIQDSCTDVLIELARNKNLTVAHQCELAKRNDIDIHISLFDNPFLCDSVRRHVVQRFSGDELARLESAYDILFFGWWGGFKSYNEAAWLPIYRRLRNGDDTETKRLHADAEYARGQSDNQHKELTALSQRIKKYKLILKNKAIDM